MQGWERVEQLDPSRLKGIQELDSLAQALPNKYADGLYAAALYIFDMAWQYGYFSGSELDREEREITRRLSKKVARYMQDRTGREVELDVRLR